MAAGHSATPGHSGLPGHSGPTGHNGPPGRGAVGRIRSWDPLAAAAALIALIMAVVYVVLSAQQDDGPAAWFLGALAVAVLLAGYGTGRAPHGRAPHGRGPHGRGPALIASGTVLTTLGLLGIFSIGLPLLVAGVLALTAGVRARGGLPAGGATAG